MAVDFGSDNGSGGNSRYYKIKKDKRLFPTGQYSWVAKVFLHPGIDTSGNTIVCTDARGTPGTYHLGTFKNSGVQKLFVQIENKTYSAVDPELLGQWALVSGTVYTNGTKSRSALYLYSSGASYEGPERDVTGTSIEVRDIYVGSRPDLAAAYILHGAIEWVYLTTDKADKTYLETVAKTNEHLYKFADNTIEFWDMVNPDPVIYGVKNKIQMLRNGTGLTSMLPGADLPTPLGTNTGTISKQLIDQLYKNCETLLVNIDLYVNGEAMNDGSKVVNAQRGFTKIDQDITNLYKHLMKWSGEPIPVDNLQQGQGMGMGQRNGGGLQFALGGDLGGDIEFDPVKEES